MKRISYSGHLTALSANLIFGLNMPVTKALLDRWMTPMGYMMSRVLFAAVFFWIASLFLKKERVSGRDLWIIAAGGFFGSGTQGGKSSDSSCLSCCLPSVWSILRPYIIRSLQP